MVILRRVTSGIREHFHIRATEWGMLVVSYFMCMALNGQRDMFSTSPSFAAVATWGREETWAAVLFACFVGRFLALVVNGTFRAFPYSPHLRLAACVVSLAFWGLFASGFAASAIYGGGAWSAVAAYSGYVVIELVNLYRSWGDVLRRR